MTTNQPCVYLHFDNNSNCFYVGFSRSNRRPHDKLNRSKSWKKHYKSHGLSRVEVIDCASIDLAKKTEMYFIQVHKDKGSPLTNKQTSYTGKHNNSYKGLTIGYSATKDDFVICDGRADIIAQGYNPGHVSSVITGKSKQHAGRTWTRTNDKRKIKPLINKTMSPESKSTLDKWLM